MNKFELVRSIVQASSAPGNRLLDVGCRGCELEPHVRGLVEYTGLDLVQNPTGTVSLVHDLSRPVPLPDGSFDFVVALDVLEHLDDFRAGLEELLRLTKRQLIVLLPNLAHLFFRRQFLLSGRLGNKYDLLTGGGRDRHRWVTVIPQTDRYLEAFAREKGVSFELQWFNDTPKKRLFARALRLAMLPPSTWAWASVYVLGKDRPSGVASTTV